MSSQRVVRVRTSEDGVAAQSLRAGIEKIQSELGVSPEFPAEVESAAASAAAAPPRPELDRTHNPFRQAVVRTPIEHVNGVVAIPTGPGLGIDINRDALSEFRMGDD